MARYDLLHGGLARCLLLNSHYFPSFFFFFARRILIWFRNPLSKLQRRVFPLLASLIHLVIYIENHDFLPQFQPNTTRLISVFSSPYLLLPSPRMKNLSSNFLICLFIFDLSISSPCVRISHCHGHFSHTLHNSGSDIPQSSPICRHTPYPTKLHSSPQCDYLPYLPLESLLPD